MKKSSENIAGFFHWTIQPNSLSINHIYSFVVYIRKVKKSESKSQLNQCAELKNNVVYIRKVKKSESKSQHQETCSTKIIFERNRGRLSTQLIRLS